MYVCECVTQYDAQLYNVGVALFDQQLARMPPSFASELAALRQDLAAYHRGGPTCVDCLGGSVVPSVSEERKQSKQARL